MLTVSETLETTSQLQLPAALPHEKKQAYVDRLVTVLGLAKVGCVWGGREGGQGGGGFWGRAAGGRRGRSRGSRGHRGQMQGLAPVRDLGDHQSAATTCCFTS